MDASQRLQIDVDDAMRSMGWSDVRIVLDHGSDVMNLTENVDVRVTREGESNWRLFTIVTVRCLEEILSKDDTDADTAEDADIYTVGGPLCVVAKITGNAIARAVRRYVMAEELRKNQGW